MASYANVASKGPKQSDEEYSNLWPTRIPPHIPEIAHSDSGVHSIDSLSTDSHVNSIPSYADQQLQAERNEAARRDGKKAADEVAREARDFTNLAEHDIAGAEKDAKSKYQQVRGEAAKEWKHLKKEASAESSKAKKEARKAEEWAEKNRNNPVVVGNVVVVGALGTLLGVGAYRMHQAGTLTWNVVGAWAGAVGLFAVGDYYVSQYFFKKYPPKN